VTRRAADIPQAARIGVAARSGSMCELCGQRRAVEVHHRRPRRMGGTRWAGIHSLANLVHLDEVCHDWAEDRSVLADAAGVRLVHRGDVDPAEVPVWLASVNGTGWYLLDPTPADGGPHLARWVDPDDYGLPPVPDLTGLQLAS
jgi:5-methylcytosine-specific restriction protein A